MENKQQKRQVAYKVSINDIMSGTYVEQEGWLPNYVQAQSGLKISRVNLVAFIVGKADDVEINLRSISLDDSTGRIEARFFEGGNVFDELNLAEPVLIIGRVRKYNNILFISPEIVKKIADVKQIELRKKELLLESMSNPVRQEFQINKAPEADAAKEESISEESVDDAIVEAPKSPRSLVFDFIKANDAGSGVEITAVLDAVKGENIEDVIQQMKLSGDIFEIRLGFLKVLD